MYEQDGTETATRDYPLEDGCTTITATRTDPYGFWYLKVNQGTLPEEYTGAYTSSYEVERAVKTYTNKLKEREAIYEEAIKKKERKESKVLEDKKESKKE